MKQETIDILRKDLNKDKSLEERFKKNEEFTYEIELLPVLTKRNKQGKLEEVTNCSSRLLFRSENGE